MIVLGIIMIILSGPHDLLAFNVFRFFITIPSGICISKINESVLSGILGTLSTASRVNTLENCFCSMLALSLSSNLSELLSFSFSNKGATPLFVFSFLRVWDQKALGFDFDSVAILFSNNPLSRRNIDLSLFLALLYRLGAKSASPCHFILVYHSFSSRFIYRIGTFVFPGRFSRYSLPWDELISEVQKFCFH